MRLNSQGGVEPLYEDEVARARNSDLITLPKDIEGTNCGNCEFFKPVAGNIGSCIHPNVAQSVSTRQCCSFWDALGTLRDF